MASRKVRPREYRRGSSTFSLFAVEHEPGLRHSDAHGADVRVLAVELDALHAVDNRPQPQFSLADDLLLFQVEADGQLDVVDVYVAVLQVVRPVARQCKGRGGKGGTRGFPLPAGQPGFRHEVPCVWSSPRLLILEFDMFRHPSLYQSSHRAPRLPRDLRPSSSEIV